MDKTSLFVFLYLCWLSNLSTPISCSQGPTVKTTKGSFEGKYLKSRNGRAYEAFIGIRYGIVPERFENAVPTEKWDGITDATEFGCACPQPLLEGGVFGDEDCLFLNIYTPRADDRRRPVLVFIHGGGFTYGAGDGYGGKYFLDEEVVLVTINYRLGVLGFLNTGDGAVSANLGLKDQVLALKWIQENIEQFGGDSSRVTISGESAGGASALYLLLSPLAQGLFHRVLSESGSPRCPWAYAENNLRNAMILADKLGCPRENTAELVACLKQKPLTEVLLAQISSFARYHLDPMFPFSPTLETKVARDPEPFLPAPPVEIMKSGQFSRVPVLMTVNREEGAFFHAGYVVLNKPLINQLDSDWNRNAPVTFLYEDDPDLQTQQMEVSNKLRNFYFGNDRVSPAKFENLTNIYTDSWFLFGIHETALGLAQHTSVYTGMITHRRKDFSILTMFGISKNFDVTAHCDELSYLYNYASEGKAMTLISRPEVVDQPDVEFSKAFVKTVVSFAATGVPKVYVPKATRWTRRPGWQCRQNTNLRRISGRRHARWVPVRPKEIQSGHLDFQNVGLEDYVHIRPFEIRMALWQSLYQ